MTITEEILKADVGFELSSEGHWDEKEIAEKGYHSFNDAGVECETGEFLYGMIRVLQPDNVLETGTHVGVGASYIGMGLKHNHNGNLDSIEFLKPNHLEAKYRITKLGVGEHVTLYLQDSLSFEPSVNYDFMFLDTEPQIRFKELIKFYPHLKEGGYVFIHDLHRHMAQVQEKHPDHPDTPYWPWGKLPDEIIDLVRNDNLRPMHFSTPRGLTGFYKPSVEDYKWEKE